MNINDLKNFQKKENGDLEVQIIDIQFLTDFSNQPFKVRTDLQMYDLMKSIENNGVLVPLIVRSNPNGNGYEIISGHRRKEACKLLGINEIPVIVREIDDCDAVIAMIDSNLQREHIRISEKAFAYVDFEAYEKIFLITVYPKNEKDNLSKAERNELRELVCVLENHLKER